jgi:hypothetical protein
LASPTTPSNINVPGPWKCDSSGLQTRLNKKNLTSNTFPAKKTLQIIKAGTTLVLTTSLSDRGIFTSLHLHANYQELPNHPL